MWKPNKSHILVMAVLAGQVGGQAWAQANPSPAVSTALLQTCKPDYAAHCIGRNPAPPIAAACLSQFYVNLSDACRAVLDAYNHPNGADAG